MPPYTVASWGHCIEVAGETMIRRLEVHDLSLLHPPDEGNCSFTSLLNPCPLRPLLGGRIIIRRESQRRVFVRARMHHQCRHYGMKLMAYTLINLRHFCVP